tara:strand:+ start:5377 stop:5943 length:567 start_codon:yes stop_codon:yes gene_type:complete
MEQSQQRTTTFAPIKERVAKTVAQRLDDKQILQMAIACSMREADDVLGLMFPPHVAKAALQNQRVSALTADEWRMLFGHEINPLRDGGVTEVVKSQEFQTPINVIGTALRCTVNEQQQKQRWGRAWNQALCYVATHMEDPHNALEVVIGAVVRSDMRRLEELHVTIDDDGCDAMLMSKILIALTDSVM